MTVSGDNIAMLDGATEPDSIEAQLGGGSIVAYTDRSPDKETENEDTVAAIPYGDDAVVLAVADGVGALPAGRRASQTAITKLAETLQAAMTETMLLRTAILDGIEAANQAVLDIGNGAATTMTVVTIEGLIARTYQVGDSEAIIVGQRGRIKSQTMVHSPTGFAVEAGFLGKREALHHEERHLVSNFIGTNDMRIDIGPAVKLRPRDTVLLASDGLTDNIHIDEVINIMRKGPLDKAIESMTRLAHHRMTNESKLQPSKPDDLSVILFRKPYRR
ncbi:MAG: protein phosphatase 2C domain-containing protein [Proteobacteria bacterium]|nr:protein phosphatase 2C domain-containing protein [Pseudomonadota bacterium]